MEAQKLIFLAATACHSEGLVAILTILQIGLKIIEKEKAHCVRSICKDLDKICKDLNSQITKQLRNCKIALMCQRMH